MESEIWKDIEFAPHYQVSNMGRVRSFRVLGSAVRISDVPRILKQFDRGNGYPHINLYSSDKRPVLMPVHRLVLLVFVGQPPIGYEACHNDSNPWNCKLDNLRWDTRSSNFLDKRTNGTSLCGEANNKTKFTSEQVLEIRRRYANGETNMNKLGREYCVSQQTISRIIKRQVWAHI